jgi:hypothetical protein
MPHPARRPVAWRRRDTTLTRGTPRGVLMLPDDSDEPLRLDTAAALVWDALDVPLTDDALVATVASRTGTQPAAVADDVVATRVALARVGAVTAVT